MYPPDHYRSMTDDQLAQWHQLQTRCDRLNALLLQEQIKTSQLVGELDNARDAHQREREDWSADFQEASRKAADQQSANRRASAALVQTLAALRRVVVVMRLIGKENVPDRFVNGWHAALVEAEAVIALYDIPF